MKRLEVHENFVQQSASTLTLALFQREKGMRQTGGAPSGWAVLQSGREVLRGNLYATVAKVSRPRE
jgi:hypothetical protein